MGRNAANSERAREAARLLNFGFENFKQEKYVKKETEILDIPVWFGKEKTIKVGMKKNVFVTVKKENPAEIKLKAVYKEPINAPVKKGEKVGELKVFKAGKVIIVHDLIALEEVKKIPFGLRLFRNVKHLIKKFI